MRRLTLFKTFPLSTALVFLYTGCITSINKTEIRNPAADICVSESGLTHLFNVLENNESRIVIELGEFQKVFNLDGANYKFEVSFKGITDELMTQEQQKAADPIVLSGEINGNNRLTIPVTGTGAYIVTLFQKTSKPFWKQKVFAIAAKDKSLKEDEKEQLAQMYAPVINYHPDELYSPVSFEYLTNQVDKDLALDDETFILTNKSVAQSLFGGLFGGSPSTLNVSFLFKDILNVLPYYGHHESVLKSGLSNSAMTRLKQRYGKDHATIYYSVFENVKRKEILINYHFFYSYDPKNGTAKKDVMPAHIFDRESMTVVLRSTSKEPLDVYYGAHLANQTMAELDSSGKPAQSWVTGRTHLNWSEKNYPNSHVEKIGTHPVPAIALGSHGVYPKPATYAVLMGNIKVLVEKAGGDKGQEKFLYPESMTDFKAPNSASYKLKSLKLENTVSGCGPANILAYSGSTVDVLGPVNASFPPFTDREENFMSYADPNAPLFDMQK
ncbi:MAG: hypothetical protein H7256_15675 [Bdellovibrio sp.]|nr:hypothetical protein [Bdellovibrio sp.]